MIDVIIPTYCEQGIIKQCIENLRAQAFNPANLNIIVCDASSEDGTAKIATEAGAEVVLSTQRQRAYQLNKGAQAAKNKILFFIHADTYCPKHFDKMIFDCLQNENIAGCFTLQFDMQHWFLKINAWFAKFNINMFRFGDQGLFVSKKIFEEIGGYNESLLLLEDQDIVVRLKKSAKFDILTSVITTSARKYKKHGVFRLQFFYYYLYCCYRTGMIQKKLHLKYQRFLCKN